MTTENLYIQLENGQPINHPLIESNFISAYPHLDPDNLPENWSKFVAIPKPVPGVYQKINEQPVYGLVDGVYTHIWTIQDMTDSEKLEEQQRTKDIMAASRNAIAYVTWTFNEEICGYEPPVPMPEDGKGYQWNRHINNWAERPPYPTDGRRYRWDLIDFDWVYWPEDTP